MLSVIVCSIDPEKQQAIRAEYERAAGEPHEFILINDARSLAEGYNRGFAQSRGEIIDVQQRKIPGYVSAKNVAIRFRFAERRAMRNIIMLAKFDNTAVGSVGVTLKRFETRG